MVVDSLPITALAVEIALNNGSQLSVSNSKSTITLSRTDVTCLVILAIIIVGVLYIIYKSNTK